MNKILMLALAPVRKNKGQTFSLLFLLVISGALLYLGLFLIINTNRFIDSKMEQLGSPDIVLNIQDTIFSEEDLDYFRNSSKTTVVETIKTVSLPSAQTEYGGGFISVGIVFLDEKKLDGMSSPHFVGEKLTAGPDSVYLPYLYHTGGGFQLGDTFTLTYNTKDYTFTIAGFFEDINLGLINIGFTGIILPDFDGFVSRLENPVYCTTILMQVYEKEDTRLIREYYADKMLNTEPELYMKSYMSATWYQNSKMACTITMNIVSVIIVLFSLLIVIVILIVVQFRITNSIEDDMINIGFLKAAGYTADQIIGGILTQFLLTALIGSGLGILISNMIMPVLSASFSTQNGLVWNMKFDIPIAILTLVLILGLVLLTSLWAARHIRTLHPIIALRGGLTTHSFKKNRFPLDKARGGLGLLLALKTIKLKQSISVALICMAVTFASSVFIILYYNVGVDDTAFFKLVMGEYFDALAYLSQDADPWQTLEDIRDMEEVRKALCCDFSSGQVGQDFLSVYITEDFSEFEGTYIYEGRSPKHNNEIAIGGGMADELGKKIGDTITVSFQGGTAEYLICGLGQSADNNGWTSQLTFDGAYRVNPHYRPTYISIYGKEGVSRDDLCEKVREELGAQIESITNMEEDKAKLDTYINLIFMITVLILCITVLVIILVLNLTVKTSILRQRRSLGIQKAMGFTTGQLRNQIVFNFMLPVLAGVSLGSIFSVFYANPLFSMLFKSIGFMRTDFTVFSPLIAVTGAAIGGLAYIVIMVVSWRIRKISAYSLISD